MGFPRSRACLRAKRDLAREWGSGGGGVGEARRKADAGVPWSCSLLWATEEPLECFSKGGRPRHLSCVGLVPLRSKCQQRIRCARD